MYFCVEDACLKQNNLHINNVMELNMRYSHASPLSLHNPLVQVSFRLFSCWVKLAPILWGDLHLLLFCIYLKDKAPAPQSVQDGKRKTFSKKTTWMWKSWHKLISRFETRVWDVLVNSRKWRECCYPDYRKFTECFLWSKGSTLFLYHM